MSLCCGMLRFSFESLIICKSKQVGISFILNAGTIPVSQITMKNDEIHQLNPYTSPGQSRRNSVLTKPRGRLHAQPQQAGSATDRPANRRKARGQTVGESVRNRADG